MEPMSLILTALLTGASAVAKDTAGEAVKDAYQGLKTLIQRKFAAKPEAELALEKHEEKPEVWKEPLKDELAQTQADQDEEIILAAQKLMSLADPERARQGAYNVSIGGSVYGFVQHNTGEINMNFGNKLPER